jgi:hypothetical protein
MKTKTNLLMLFFMILFFISKSLNAQDIIIKKNGDEIKAKVMEVGITEIKYKKFENLETSPIYSILKSDVFMIKYADGTKDVFGTDSQSQSQKPDSTATMNNNTSTDNKNKISNKTSISNQNSHSASSKIVLGTGRSFVNSYNVGNLNDFYQNLSGDPTEKCDAGAPVLMTFHFGFRNCIDTSMKNWFGVDMQFVKTAPHAIWGSTVYYGGGIDLHFDGFFMNIPLTYMHAIDSKKHIFLAAEPALDMGLIDGGVYIGDTTYTEAMSFGAGFHIAAGIDYMGKWFGANARLGYRHLKTPEVHYNDKSTTGYSSFYVNGASGETVKVDWSGVYFNIGIYLAIDRKQRK